MRLIDADNLLDIIYQKYYDSKISAWELATVEAVLEVYAPTVKGEDKYGVYQQTGNN